MQLSAALTWSLLQVLLSSFPARALAIEPVGAGRAPEITLADAGTPWYRAVELRNAGELAVARELVAELAALEAAPAWFHSDLAWLRATLETEPSEGLALAWRDAVAAAEAFEQGEREDAVALGTRALAGLESELGADHPETAYERVRQAWRIGHVRDAATWLERGQAALGAAERSTPRGHPIRAMAAGVVAYATMNSGDMDAAWARFQEAVDLWNDVGSPPDVYTPWHVQAASGLALVANLRGEHDVADEAFRVAIDLVRRSDGEESHNYANLLGNLAESLSERGETARALPLLRRSVALKTRVLDPGHPSLAAGLHNLGVLLLTSGETAEAQRILEDALERSADDWGRNAQLVALLDTLGQARFAAGEFVPARRLLERAQRLGQRHFPERDDDRTRRSLSLAHVALADGRGAEAHATFEQVARRDPESRSAAAALRGLAELAWQRSEVDEARRFATESLGLYRQFSPVEPGIEAALETLLARAAARTGTLDAATRHLEHAEVAYELARAHRPPGVARAAFAPRSFAPLLAAVRAESGSPAAAWLASEEGRGQALFELLLAAGARRLDPATAERLRTTHEALEAQERLLADPAVTPEVRQRTEALVHAFQAELARIQSELDARQPVEEGRAYPLERVQSSLAAHEALIGWIWSAVPGPERRLWTWVLRNTGEVRFSRPHSVPELEERLADWRNELADGALAAFPAAVATDTARLREELFGALVNDERYADVAHAIVVATHPVLGVPLDLLVEDRLALSYVPSATISAWLRARPAGGEPDSALLLGDPPFRSEHLAEPDDETAPPRGGRGPFGQRDLGADPATLPRLPHSRVEVERIAQRFERVTRLVGAAANEVDLRAIELEDFDVLHFATHALVDDQRPDRSALVLSQLDLPDPLEAALGGVPPADGLVTAGEIAAGWQLQAELVTLSACETALGRSVRGEGYLGLVQAFFQAGARSVLASLWAVDDRATALFMDAFYRAWMDNGDELSKAEAVRRARAELREWRDAEGRMPYGHAGVWGAFVLLGDGR